MSMMVTTRNGSIEIGTMAIPGRKNKALYRTRGANIEVLAYFRSDHAAERFDEALDWMIAEWEKREEPT